MTRQNPQSSLVGRAFRAMVRSRERQAQRYVNAYLADRGIAPLRQPR